MPDRGPAAGLENALEAVGAPWVAAVAGDMPFVDADLLDALFDRADAADGAVTEIGGHRQPTHAVYRTDALRLAAEDAVEHADGSLRAILDRLDVAVVPEETATSLTERPTFFDVNTVADLERAAEKNGDFPTDER